MGISLASRKASGPASGFHTRGERDMKIFTEAYAIKWPERIGPQGFDVDWIKKRKGHLVDKFRSHFGCSPGTSDMKDCKVVRVHIAESPDA